MILVLGTGRSGTSEVARILHEDLGVNMGHAFHIGDHFNKKGYYEDREFQSLNLSFYLMHLDEIDDEEPWRLWREEFYKLVERRSEPWGLKDPGIADIPRLFNEYLSLNPYLIYCTRPKEDTINSLMRFKNKSREEMEAIYNQRKENIEAVLKDKEYLEVKCYEADKDKKIRKWYNTVIKS